ncbi:MAG: D-glycero-beta-D-manno-heptose 1,7-bisphosphate 7-phosphatase [Kiritimatiellales bacterium]
MSAGQKAFFLDRDGVINVDHGYVFRIEDFEFIKSVFPVFRQLVEKGYKLVVVTNQSGIGRGYYTEEDFRKLNEWMIQKFAEQNVEIAAVYSCPHAPEEKCSCRKPVPGMFLRAIREYDLDPVRSWMLGDKDTDMAAAETAGIPNRVLMGGAESAHCTHRVAELIEVLDLPV